VSAFFSGLSGHSLPQVLWDSRRCEYRRDALRESGRTRLLFSVMASPCGRPWPWFVRVGGGRQRVAVNGQEPRCGGPGTPTSSTGGVTVHDSATRHTATHANYPHLTLKNGKVYKNS